MAKRMPIALFVAEIEAALKRKDGYIMAAHGENPRTGYLDLSVQKVKSSWKPAGWYFAQYKDPDQRAQALRWRKNCTRVWDCNGLSEGIYEIWSGHCINARARNNYGSWCGKRGAGMIPAKYRVPGAAVFWGRNAANIHHVAYLYKPVTPGKPEGDWYLIEARGVMYGVVKTRLYSRKPNFWGWMDKYYDYTGTSAATPEKPEEKPVDILRKGDEGAEVRELQRGLLIWKPDCLPKYGADGDFGAETEAAVKAFQKAAGVPETGICDATTAALVKGWGTAKTVTVTGGRVNIRTKPDTTGRVIGVVSRGDVMPYVSTAPTGWHCVMFDGVAAYISNKYSRITA